MKERKFPTQKMKKYEDSLRNDEKSEATIEKYLRDVRCFSSFVGKEQINKEMVMEYKASLGKDYAVASANSMIASLNSFFRFCGWYDLCVKQFRVQRDAFCSENNELTKAEYTRLVNTAKRKNNERLCLIIQTICSTGIRVSELEYITAEAVTRGEATVKCKGKNRRIFIISVLRKKLLSYMRD
ncbi:MAG: site-specific integrase, partial [Clostridia bacterium]|nr:site-specific integrase [Clostridia bacterium]